MIQSGKMMLKLMGMSTECAAQIIDNHNNIPNITFKQMNCAYLIPN